MFTTLREPRNFRLFSSRSAESTAKRDSQILHRHHRITRQHRRPLPLLLLRPKRQNRNSSAPYSSPSTKANVPSQTYPSTPSGTIEYSPFMPSKPRPRQAPRGKTSLSAPAATNGLYLRRVEVRMLSHSTYQSGVSRRRRAVSAGGWTRAMILLFAAWAGREGDEGRGGLF